MSQTPSGEIFVDLDAEPHSFSAPGAPRQRGTTGPRGNSRLLLAALGALALIALVIAAVAFFTRDSDPADDTTTTVDVPANVTPIPGDTGEPDQTVSSATDAPPTVQTGPPVAATATPAPATDPVAPNAAILDEVLTLRGFGALQFGMTVPEAEQALGIDLVDLGGEGNQQCRHGSVAGSADDTGYPRFMVITDSGDFELGQVRRVELGSSSVTRSGIGIGSTKDEVLAAYGDRIEVSPRKYTFAEGGEYLTFIPADAADADYRLIMETLDDRVTAIRAGLLPEVEFVEGCL